MLYLSAEYKLEQLSDEEYVSSLRSVVVSIKLNKMTAALELALKHEHPDLAGIIGRNAIHLHQMYGVGGDMYAITAAAGIKALRSRNPTVRPIGTEQWGDAMNRELELRVRPAVTNVELLSGLGLAEVRDVNAGYVDGFQASFQRPSFMEVSGIIGLAALHSHDLMHFASQG